MTPARFRRRCGLRAAALAFLALSLATQQAGAVRMQQNENQGKDVEEEEVQEETPQLPPYPRDSNLIEFAPYGRTTNRYYVDGSSVSVGRDKIVRFTVVAKSKLGGEHVAFAGVNCKRQEWKDYAYGTPEKLWRQQTDPPWQRIENLATNDYKYSLFKDFMCFGGVMSGGPAGSAKLIVRNLKNPPKPDPRTSLRPMN